MMFCEYLTPEVRKSDYMFRDVEDRFAMWVYSIRELSRNEEIEDSFA